MILLYLAFVVLFFIPLPVFFRAGRKGFDQYLSRDATLPIKGMFVVLVFFRHFHQYITLSNSLFDRMFEFVDNYSGQLIVTVFFFYSGFGIYESIKRKGSSYLSDFPRKRLLPTWINFALCIVLFLIYDLLIGCELDAVSVILAFFGWTSIGNSNWFMFATFLLYLLVMVSFISFDDTKEQRCVRRLVLFSFMTLASMVVLYMTKPAYWYNTMLCFPLGMWFSFYKDRIDGLLEKHYGLVLAGTLLVLVITYLLNSKLNKLFYCVYAPAFALLVTVITVRIRGRSVVLGFLGKHVFSIYLLQRIPMGMFQNLIGNKYIYFIVTFVITILISVAFDYATKNIKAVLCKR